MSHTSVMSRASALRVLVTLLVLLGLSLTAPVGAAPTVRRVVLAPDGAGYRWVITQAPVPVPGPGQIRMKVHAVSLNHTELAMLQPDPGHDHTGLVPCADAAGEIVAVGAGVTGLAVGMRVTSTHFAGWADGPFSRRYLDHGRGWSTDGVLADEILLDAASAVPVPASFSDEEAATLPTAAVTAWNALQGAHGTVLVQGTGGVSTFALQFAVAMGARVIVTSSSDAKLAHARALGAAGVINYHLLPEWSGRVMELTQDHGADLILDVGGKSTLAQSVASLADGGEIALIGGLTGYDGQLAAWGLIERTARARGVFVGSRADYLRMAAFMEAHHLHPLIDRVYPLEQYPDALKALASGAFMGKIVLRLSGAEDPSRWPTVGRP